MRTTAPSPQTVVADALRHHREGRLDEAERLYRQILKTMPRNADALHLLGVVAHQRGNHERARQLIAKSIAVNPKDAASHNNLGAVLLALNRLQPAVASFERALALKPDYAEARNNLGNALQLSERPREAIEEYRQAIAIHPNYAEAHCNLGRAFHAVGELETAAECYRRALTIQPAYGKCLKNLGDVLGELGQPEAAESRYREALACTPQDPETLAALAALLEHSSQLEQALATAETALNLDPCNVRAAVVAAKCERRLGKPEAALGRLEALDLSRHERQSRAFAQYEIGAICDRLGQYRRAYRCFAEGNRLILGGPLGKAVDPASLPRRIERLMDRFGPDWLAAWTPPFPCGGSEPAFLIGFPRSGTTLLEQILDAHPAIAAIEEKPMLDVVRLAIDEKPSGYPEALAALTEEEISALRRLYFAEAERYRSDLGEARLLDKMPLNTIDVGLIYRLFPTAKLLFALRHPCDVVLSGFMQAFRPNPAMVQFGTLVGAARFYAQVMNLWLRYIDTLPIVSQMVRYEDLVADLVGETRRILAFLEVPWDEQVLAYSERAKTRPISTPSYHQVVQPVYSSSIGRWQNYREAFAEAFSLLQPFIRRFGYQEDG
jgi:tetratricopeptide (TPR) repeat protein